MFTIIGKMRGDKYEVTWDDGELTNKGRSLFPAQYIKSLAESYDGQYVGKSTMGAPKKKNHLKNPLSALIIMQEACDVIEIGRESCR